MRALSASDIVKVWEVGQDRHPVDRALCLLGAAFPEAPWRELAALPVGRRDAALLALREQSFGGTLEGRASCPACASDLELSAAIADLHTPPPPLVDTLATEGFELRFRLPDSLDLAAVARFRDPRAARAELLRRCVMEARRGDTPVPPEALPEPVVAQLSALMAEQDPQAEVLFDLTCPACGRDFQAPLDIVSFLWTELSAEAARLLGDIHTLARAYHWREADILAMSSRRRRAYLEMVGA
jgi:hypothetical protein